MVITDESFKRPGAVPFSWEIQPGVPKSPLHHPDNNLNPPKKLSPLRLKPLHPPPPEIPPPSSPFISNLRKLPPPPFLTPSPSSKLKPPPGSGFHSPSPRTPSLRSSPRAFSERWLLQRPNQVRPRPDCVVAEPGCLPSPLFRLKRSRSSVTKRTATRLELEYGSDMEMIMSSKRSISPMWVSPKSSFSSNRFDGEAEWVGFGLF